MCSKVIYDIGMHKGEDTAFYLSRGFSVVGVEANPQLVKHLIDRFSHEINDGRLKIVPKAIAKTAGEVTFYINESQSVWGSIDPEFVKRNDALGTSSRPSTVPAITIADLVNEFADPYYVKIDIEGVDLDCLVGLLSTPKRPQYISIESSVTSPKGNWVDEINILAGKGYDQFKYVDQSKLHELDGQMLSSEGAPIQYRFAQDSSGPFGQEAPGEWLTLETALLKAKALNKNFQTYSLFSNSPRWLVKIARRFKGIKNTDAQSWYDLHARFSDRQKP